MDLDLISAPGWLAYLEASQRLVVSVFFCSSTMRVLSAVFTLHDVLESGCFHPSTLLWTCYLVLRPPASCAAVVAASLSSCVDVYCEPSSAFAPSLAQR